MQKRRKYSQEFKQGAVEQARQPGVSCAEVARDLGIAANLLSRWKREADAGGGDTRRLPAQATHEMKKSLA